MTNNRFKKKTRKALTTIKKPLPAEREAYSEKQLSQQSSVSPSIKLKKRADKSASFMHPNYNNLTRVRSGEGSVNSSFTIEGNKSAVEGKNLMDEFNNKYNTADPSENMSELEKSDRKQSTSSAKPPDFNENVAIIHVIDETKKRKQDFK